MGNHSRLCRCQATKKIHGLRRSRHEWRDGSEDHAHLAWASGRGADERHHTYIPRRCRHRTMISVLVGLASRAGILGMAKPRAAPRILPSSRKVSCRWLPRTMPSTRYVSPPPPRASTQRSRRRDDRSDVRRLRIQGQFARCISSVDAGAPCCLSAAMLSATTQSATHSPNVSETISADVVDFVPKPINILDTPRLTQLSQLLIHPPVRRQRKNVMRTRKCITHLI